MAIHSPNVSVGARYNLNCDVSPWNIPPAPAGLIGHTKGTALVGNAKIGNHFPRV